MSKTSKLKNLLKTQELDFIIEAHNGISARIAEEAGFKGIWASGLALSAQYGVRDNNEASWTQIVDMVEFMADVTSIRTKREGDEYRYSIVDEHGDTYSLQTETSELPFSLDELVDFIDFSEQNGGWSGGISLSYNNANAESQSREQLRHFTRISSEIYPQLEEHYENVFSDWIEEEKVIS